MKRIKALLFTGSSSADSPDIMIVKCLEPGFDLCLEVEFDSEIDFALLNQKIPGNNCIFEGYFQNAPATRVFVSSMDCPIDKDSKLEV